MASMLKMMSIDAWASINRLPPLVDRKGLDGLHEGTETAHRHGRLRLLAPFLDLVLTAAEHRVMDLQLD